MLYYTLDRAAREGDVSNGAVGLLSSLAEPAAS